ncbi:MAG: hypothetical protein ACK4WB_04430 [Desulfatiglandales bacterium]
MGHHIPLTRKIGIGIVFIVPSFVFAGLLWHFVSSWLAVLGLEIVMAIIYSLVLKGKLFLRSQEAH